MQRNLPCYKSLINNTINCITAYILSDSHLEYLIIPSLNITSPWHMMPARTVLWGKGISYTKCPQVLVFDLNYTYCLYWKFLPLCSTTRWQNSGFRHCFSSIANVSTSTLKFCFSIFPISPSTKFVGLKRSCYAAFITTNPPKQTKTQTNKTPCQKE